MSLFVKSVIGALALLYPLAIYFGINYIQPWLIAVILASLLLARFHNEPALDKHKRLILIIAVLYCSLAIWNNDLITLRFYPVLINLSLMIIFIASLYFPPPVIERLARLQHPDLLPKGVTYTRKVTKIWSVFFLINGLIAAATALWCSFVWWSLYNGLIAYVLMGLLMAIEYWVRGRTQDYVS